MGENRYKRLRISSELLMQLWKNGEHPGYSVENGIPEGSRLVNVKHAWPNAVELLIESSGFPVLEEQAEGEEFMPVVTAMQGEINQQ